MKRVSSSSSLFDHPRVTVSRTVYQGPCDACRERDRLRSSRNLGTQLAVQKVVVIDAGIIRAQLSSSGESCPPSVEERSSSSARIILRHARAAAQSADLLARWACEPLFGHDSAMVDAGPSNAHGCFVFFKPTLTKIRGAGCMRT